MYWWEFHEKKTGKGVNFFNHTISSVQKAHILTAIIALILLVLNIFNKY